MKASGPSQRTPKYFSYAQKPSSIKLAAKLSIEVPDYDEDMPVRAHNTTPNSKTQDGGFFKHGKNSPNSASIFKK
jgi:hypothetical protein